MLRSHASVSKFMHVVLRNSLAIKVYMMSLNVFLDYIFLISSNFLCQFVVIKASGIFNSTAFSPLLYKHGFLPVKIYQTKRKKKRIPHVSYSQMQAWQFKDNNLHTKVRLTTHVLVLHNTLNTRTHVRGDKTLSLVLIPQCSLIL